MPLVLVVAVAALLWALVVLGYVASPLSRTVIRIRRGEIRVEGAELGARAKEHVADVIRDAMLMRGFITLSSRREVTFSRDVPHVMRQRLRNILLN